MLKAAEQPLHAMILLAINCGLGNSDVGRLTKSAIDLDSGWLDFPRQKTGIPRRVPLWEETVSSLRKWFAERPQPKNGTSNELVFLTSTGASWLKALGGNQISDEIAKLMRGVGVNQKGMGFYSLRRTFRTIAGEARDEPAANSIMGHAAQADDMAAVYTQRIDDQRLLAVTNHVRTWLFAKRSAK